jgi:hypothetical protein
MRYLIATTLATAALVALPATAAALQQRFFLSPSGNISCELDYNPGAASGGLPTQAFCETFKPGRSVTMTPTGRLHICHGTSCLGDPPENAFTLKYGKTSSLGPFTCSSRKSGMSCRTSSGPGFTISRTGIKHT